MQGENISIDSTKLDSYEAPKPKFKINDDQSSYNYLRLVLTVFPREKFQNNDNFLDDLLLWDPKVQKYENRITAK